jgi:hypothetical protein
MYGPFLIFTSSAWQSLLAVSWRLLPLRGWLGPSNSLNYRQLKYETLHKSVMDPSDEWSQNCLLCILLELVRFGWGLNRGEPVSFVLGELPRYLISSEISDFVKTCGILNSDKWEAVGRELLEGARLRVRSWVFVMKQVISQRPCFSTTNSCVTRSLRWRITARLHSR